MGQIWYSTRERVIRTLEMSHTSRVFRLIDSKLSGASLSAEALTHRRFYPELKTVRYDYPNFDFSPSWRLNLGDNEVITSDDMVLRSGTTTIDANDILLRRYDGKDEPPYTHLELRIDGDGWFGQGPTFQQDIQLTAHVGYRNDSTPGGELAAGIDTSATTVDINPLGGGLKVETGSLITIGSERMVTTNRQMLDTGTHLTSNVDASNGVTVIPVSDGTVFAPDEVIAVGSERMSIIDILGNNLVVERAYDGTLLDAHATNDDVYAWRRFTVERGVLGTTAASHNSGDDVSVFVYPGLVEELTTGEAIVLLEQSTGAFAATRGGGESGKASTVGAGLPDLRDRTYVAHGRKLRLSGI